MKTTSFDIGNIRQKPAGALFCSFEWVSWVWSFHKIGELWTLAAELYGIHPSRPCDGADLCRVLHRLSPTGIRDRLDDTTRAGVGSHRDVVGGDDYWRATRHRRSLSHAKPAQGAIAGSLPDLVDGSYGDLRCFIRHPRLSEGCDAGATL